MNKRRPDATVAWALAICYIGLAIAFGHDIQQSGHGANVLAGAAGCLPVPSPMRFTIWVPARSSLD